MEVWDNQGCFKVVECECKCEEEVGVDWVEGDDDDELHRNT